jgi:nitroreductase
MTIKIHRYCEEIIMQQVMESITHSIRSRRTIRQFNGQPLPKESVIELLREAVWAPFHSVKEPWRFILFEGEGRKRFAEAVRKAAPPEKLQKFGHMLKKQLCEEIPVHLLVVIQADQPQKKFEDAFAASAALIQNLQLAAWEKKIGVVWKTSGYIRNPEFMEMVGVKPNEKIVAALHMGYFDENQIPQPKPRTPVEELLTVHQS